MNALWFEFADRTTIYPGDFLTSTALDYRLASTSEICGYLANLQSIDNIFSEKKRTLQKLNYD